MQHTLFDLKGQDAEIADEISEAVSSVLASGQFILGPESKAFEAEMASFCGSEHALGVASGTDALILALKALDIGVGDEVVTTPFTFGASGGSIAWVGATPVFADIDPETLNLDPASVRRAITPKTRAVLAVHVFGLPANMDALGEITSEHGIHLIEDAAQAVGATFEGLPAGSLGDVACFSFYPTKNLGAYGDGGLVTTSSEELAGSLAALRAHGSLSKYVYDSHGTNSRLDDIQAAILRVKLSKLSDWSEARRQNASIYREVLSDVSEITLPAEPAGSTHVYHLYTIRVSDPDDLASKLADRGVGTGRYYPLPLHLMPAYADRGYGVGDLPVSEEACRTCLSIPVHPTLGSEDIFEIANHIREIVHSRRI